MRTLANTRNFRDFSSLERLDFDPKYRKISRHECTERLKGFDLVEFPHDGGLRGSSQVTISRTGFTGDLGYELFVPSGQALSLWDRLMAAGELRGIRAIGYTALNRARLEAGLIVANSDFVTSEHAIRADRLRMPDEIGLGFAGNRRSQTGIT